MYVLACAQASTAQDIDGTDSPRFVQAKQDWLAGEDMPALEELAALAHEGHAPAKILLSRIAATPHVIDPVTQTLDRKAKIALLREPVGLSGRDWLVSAAEEDNDLAHALWAVAAPGKIAPDAEVARTLIAFGEIKPALTYALALWKAGKGEEAAQILHEHEARFEDATYWASPRFFSDVEHLLARGDWPGCH